MIKKYTLYTGLLLLGLLQTIRAQDPLKSSTLYIGVEQAVEIALNESPTIKVAQLEIQKKNYAKKSAQAALYPQIDAMGQYTRTLKKMVTYMDGAFDMRGMFTPALASVDQTLQTNVPGYQAGELFTNFDAIYNQAMEGQSGNDGFTVGRDNDWQGGISLSWPVVVPTLWKSLQINSLDIEIAVEQARSSRVTTSNEVKKACYAVLLAQDAYAVFKESHQNAELNYKEVKTKYEKGLVAEIDLIRADVRVKNEKPNLMQAQNALAMSVLSLKALMGIDMDQALVLTDELKNYEELLFAELVQADTSLAANSDLKLLDLQAQQLAKSLELYKAQYWPVVSVFGSYLYMSMNNDFRFSAYRWNPYSTVGLSVSIPLFDGFRKHNDSKQAKVSLEQMKWQREDVVRKLSLSVQNSVNSMTTYAEQVFSTKGVVKMAQKAYAISQKLYDTGMGTYLELNDAQLAYTQAHLQYNQAIYNYLVAKTDLAKTMGLE